MILKRTPLYDRHVAAGARIVDFGGWAMPVQYAGIQAEHRAVRTSAGLFDVSHMGEIEVYGADAVASVNRLVTNDLTAIADGQALYTVMCRPDGGIVDDLVIYRRNEGHVFICCNAANREKDFDWIEANLRDAQAMQRSDAYAQIALQGPKSVVILQQLTRTSLGEIGRYWFDQGEIAGHSAIISRTGYTGEDGFELYVAPDGASAVWDAIIEVGGGDVVPVGLGARDTLRLEMKYALYGNDIDDTTTPLEAGLGWVVKLGTTEFIGRDALLRQKETRPNRRLVGFVVDDRAVARHGYEVVDAAGEVIGKVTSGTRSPSTGQNIGLAYVPFGAHKIGMRHAVRIRGRDVPIEIVKTPFYRP